MNPIQQLHLAAQYLAAANMSCIPKREDDSHSNLGWDSKQKMLVTYPLNERGLKLGLSIEHYSLDFMMPEAGVVASYPIKNARHLDVVNWIGREFEYMGLTDTYKYAFHYVLPYDPISDEFVFDGEEGEELNAFAAYLDLAMNGIQEVGGLFRSMSEPRIWPHHFDLGSMGYPETEGASIGIGLAMPDTMIDGFYLYVSGYKGNDAIVIPQGSKLSKGEWRMEGWKGATLKLQPNIEDSEASIFLNEAVAEYLSLLA